jgi:hypothetical protein
MAVGRRKGALNHPSRGAVRGWRVCIGSGLFRAVISPVGLLPQKKGECEAGDRRRQEKIDPVDLSCTGQRSPFHSS